MAKNENRRKPAKFSEEERASRRGRLGRALSFAQQFRRFPGSRDDFSQQRRRLHSSLQSQLEPDLRQLAACHGTTRSSSTTTRKITSACSPNRGSSRATDGLSN